MNESIVERGLQEFDIESVAEGLSMLIREELMNVGTLSATEQTGLDILKAGLGEEKLEVSSEWGKRIVLLVGLAGNAAATKIERHRRQVFMSDINNKVP
jgi:hypothetical protein